VLKFLRIGNFKSPILEGNFVKYTSATAFILAVRLCLYVTSFFVHCTWTRLRG